MESAAIRGAGWVVGKALSPLSGGLVEAWAATTELEPNIKAVKMELLGAQAMLDNARGMEIRSHALGELLQKLRRLAYSAEDVLDELDYFRIQDKLEDTFEAVDDRGCTRNLLRDVRHAVTAAAKQLGCASLMSTAPCSDDRARTTAQAAKQLCWASRSSTARGSDEESTAHVFGKRFLCSSLHVRDDSSHVPMVPKSKFDRVDVSRKMKCIADELKPLCATVSTILGLELSGSVVTKLGLMGSSSVTGNSTSTTRSITTSQAVVPSFYGRDAEKDTIIADITEFECIHRDLTVLPIVGPAGIGKTTLAQYIYNDHHVKDHFSIRVWVSVSLSFNMYKLTREILGSIHNFGNEKNDRSDNEVQNLDQLQKLIKKRLKNRRFLLVLDDIWKYANEDEWNRFLAPFKKAQGNGDIVLVTTQFLEVAKMVKRGDNMLQLEGLQLKDYRNLFLACVSDETNHQHINENLLEIGENIIKKMNGSPLAAKTVAKLLTENLTVDHWTRVLESNECESQTSEHHIMRALKLSYDYLPFDLQQCFSSCALFPKDYKFECEDLIHFWIGLDILQQGHTTKRIEDIGRHNLNELVSYGFFKKETDPSGTHYYVMGDLLHNLASKVSSQECLHIVSSSLRDVEIAPYVYHLSISISDPADGVDGVLGEKFKEGLDKIRRMINFENLRTLMLFGNYDARFLHIFGDLFKNAKSLRVVFLSTMHYRVESLLQNFSELVHLRYLRLVSPKYGCKEQLPRIIPRFYRLRVLDIRHWYGSHSLLGDMTNLENLRHFLSHNDELHSNICNVGKLHSLQELQRFEVRKESSGFELRELGRLEELGGSLGIYNLENATVNEAHEANLSYKKHLQKLTLSWKKNRSNTDPAAEDQVLESLRPQNNIHELCIDGHGGSTCPTWLGANLSTRGLEALRLDSTDWESLPPLGELYLVRETGEQYFGCISGPKFHNLKRLELIGLPRLTSWVNMYPWMIEVLIVKKCPELQRVPFLHYYDGSLPEDDLNVTSFGRLRKIKIENCPKLWLLPPTPFSRTLCSVNLEHVGNGLEWLRYSNKSFMCLEMKGNDALCSIGMTVLQLVNLTQLQELSIENCPPLSERDLQMLTSLKTLKISSSSIMFEPVVTSDVKWKLSVTHLIIVTWNARGKELTRLLSHLPMLSRLEIHVCNKITRLGVEAEQKQTAASLSMPASSVFRLQDTHGTDQRQEVALEVEEEVAAQEVGVEQEEDDDDDDDVDAELLLLPADLPDSLKYFSIDSCPELILIVHPHGAGGGLQAMLSLETILIDDCPNFLSAYKDSDISSCCPFPSSLRELGLEGRMDTLVPLSNLTSLQVLSVVNCGKDFRCEGVLPLLTQGQLTTLRVSDSPSFFAGWDPAQELQGGQEQPSSKLQELKTDDIEGVLALPICRLLSSSLTKFSLVTNKEVERFTKQQEEALCLLTSLQKLEFGYCDNLRCLPSGLRNLTSLGRLDINECPTIRSLPKNGLPRSLQELVIMDCNKLRYLPAGLHNLTNLKRLRIYHCRAIRSLPKNGLPSSLQELDVSDCDNEKLTQRCRRLVGTTPLIEL